MSDVTADGSKGVLLVLPALGKVGLAAGGSTHAPEDSGSNRIEFRFPRADYIDRNAFGLGQFAYILRSDHAGPVRAVGKHHYYFSAGIRARVLKSQQQRIVKCRIVSSDGGTHAPQNLHPVGGEQRAAVKVAAIGIESHSFRIIQGPDKLCDSILREGKATVHIVAGVKEDENIGARRLSKLISLGVLLSSNVNRLLWAVAFTEGSDFLWNVIFVNGKVRRTKTGYIAPLVVGYRHVQQHQVDVNPKGLSIGLNVLRRDRNCRAEEGNSKNQNM